MRWLQQRHSYGYWKSKAGNWNEECQFNNQKFRDHPEAKKVRPLDVAITTYDDKGFQRAMPRLSRRTKWDTKHVILDDGFVTACTNFRKCTTPAWSRTSHMARSSLISRQPKSR
jgi:hypothetical protein